MSAAEANRSVRRSTGLIAALALVVAACGGSDEAAGVVAPDPIGENETTVPSEELAGVGEAIQENGPITVTGTPLVPFDPAIADPAVGQAAPIVDGESFDGVGISVGGEADNPTMIVFLAHWCPHCNDEIPELLSLRAAGSLPDDLDVVAVSTAVDASAPNYPPSEWIVDKGWPWATMADDAELSAIRAFGGSGYPFTTIVDADGTVLGRRSGSATADQILDFVNSAVG